MRLKPKPRTVSANELGSSREKFDALVRESMAQLIEQMEQLNGQGWVKPWKNVPGASQPPYNPVTGHRYTRGNLLLLQIQSLVRGYADPRFLTFKQCEEFGPDVHVRRGERGIQLLRPMTRTVETLAEEPDPNELVTPELAFADPEVTVRNLVFFRPYTVFNAEQIEGFPALDAGAVQSWDDEEDHPVDLLFAASGAPCTHGGNQAFCMPNANRIQMPPKSSFEQAEYYYATKAHEWYHWTGGDAREQRDLAGRSDIKRYAFEELRAETFSMLLGRAFGLPFDITEHAAYIESWKNELNKDPKAVFAAAIESSRMVEVALDVAAGRQPTPSWFPLKDTWPEQAFPDVEVSAPDCAPQAC